MTIQALYSRQAKNRLPGKCLHTVDKKKTECDETLSGVQVEKLANGKLCQLNRLTWAPDKQLPNNQQFSQHFIAAIFRGDASSTVNSALS